MSVVVAGMAAEAERPEEVNIPPCENRPSTSLRAGSGWGGPACDESQSPPPVSAKNAETRVGQPRAAENGLEVGDLLAHQFPQPAECGDVDQERRIYRGRTVAMLRRYMRYSIETGRLPSLLGREFFRAKVTQYTVVTFEDRVIFVHDMEMCLERLDEFSRQLIARYILQEHDRWATAKLLHCNEKTVRRLIPLVLDQLGEILLEVGLLEQVAAVRENSCQGGPEHEIFVSDCEEGK